MLIICGTLVMLQQTDTLAMARLLKEPGRYVKTDS